MEILLTIAVLLPLASAFLAFLLPANKPRTIRGLAIATTGVSLALILTLFVQFNRADAGYQFVKGWEWFTLGGATVSLKLGVDGISMVLLLLTGLVSFCGVLVSHEIHERQKEYYILFLALTTGIMGTFASVDLFFFYFFYEMAVIPMYLLIGIWGSLPAGRHGRTKEYATMKLTLYLTAGAVLALVALLAMYGHYGTFDMEKLRGMKSLSAPTQVALFPLILFGFGFLASLFPFHTWSPLGYAAAPTAASMMHAGVLKKLGAYGIIRIGLELLPLGASTPISVGAEALKHYDKTIGGVPVLGGLFKCSVHCLSGCQFTWGEVLAVLCIFNILYAGWAAMAQKDWKFIVGYSSVSHMGYVMLGIATLNTIGVSGAVFLMFAHGLMAALTFSLIGWFYHQAHTRNVPDLGGLAKKMPFIAVLMVMAAMASSGLPGFAKFASEVMVFIGAWKAWKEQSFVFLIATICAVWGIVVTATYLLRAVRSTFYGPMDAKWEKLQDAPTLWRRMPYIVLVAALLVFGFFPKLATELIWQSVDKSVAVDPNVRRWNTQQPVTPKSEIRSSKSEGNPKAENVKKAQAGTPMPPIENLKQ